MALPVTITGLLVATTNNDTVTKPFISSAGNVYVFGKGTTTNLLRAFKATDPTSSFSNVGTDVTVTSTNAIQAVDAVQSGDNIHVITTDAAAATTVDLRYHVFSMASDSWTTSNETIVNDYAVVTLATAIHAAVAIRSDGDVIVLYNGPLVNICAADRETVYYARRESGSWTVNVEVSNAGSTAWFAGGVVIGSSDRMHFFFIDDTANDAYQRTLTSANVLQAFPSSYDASINTTQISALAVGTSYNDGGTVRVRYPQQDNTGVILLSAKLDSADTPTVSTDADITGATDVESGAHRASFAANGTTLWNTFVGSADSDIYTQSNANDGGWSAPASFAVENSNGVRTNVYTRGTRIILAMVYNSSSNTLYNEKDLGAAPATGSDIDSDAVASVTWGGASTGSTAFDSDAVALLTWNGRSFAASAFDSDAIAVLTWNGRSFAASALDADATALLTWNGISTAGAAFAQDAAASLTWNGASYVASAFDQDAAAALAWNGASTATTSLSAAAVASLTWNGAEVLSAAFDADAAASLTWNGSAINIQAGAWASDVVASVTWTGISTVSAAISSTAIAGLTWNGVSTAAAGLTAAATANITWNGETIVAASAADWHAFAAANLIWNGVSTSASSFDTAATASLTWNGESIQAASGGAWSLVAVSNATFTSGSFAEAGFDIDVTARVVLRGDALGAARPVYLDGRKPRKIPTINDDAEVRLIMAIVHLDMELNYNVNY